MQSLAELKAENARKEAEEAETTEVQEELFEEEVEEEETAEPEEGEDSEEESPDSENTEAWLQEEGEAEVKFTDSDVAAAKRKLRAKMERKHESELEELKAEIAQLKSNTPTLVATTPTPRPKAEDFDSDEAFDQAMDAWYESKIDAKLVGQNQKLAEQTKLREAKQRLTQAVDQHYERAYTLTQEHGISGEVYHAADQAVRTMVENIRPGQGDLIVEQLISHLGDGSEKVMYYLGRNTNALNELQSALVRDPQGLEAAILVGSMKGKVLNPVKRQSKAPKPATQLKGDETMSGASYLKKYRAAHKKGDHQAAFKARREAKKAGVDISNWS